MTKSVQECAYALVKSSDEGLLKSIIADYRKLLETIDLAIAEAQKKQVISEYCTPGSCVCCKGVFEVSLFDAILILDAVSKLETSQKTALKANEFCNKISELGWEAPFIYSGLDEEKLEDQISELDNHDCPLLDEKGLCKIYESRPSICRMQGAKFLDPVTGNVLEDECPKANKEDGMIEFSLSDFNISEMELYEKMCHILPKFSEFELDEWDTIISAPMAWRKMSEI